MDNSNITKENVSNAHLLSMQIHNTSIDSDALFTQGDDVVFIYHQGQQYSLRRTRNGKLILTK